MHGRRLAIVLSAIPLSGCGLGVSQLPEAWDRRDQFSTGQMEMQIKRAIFCELRKGAIAARQLNSNHRSFRGTDVTSDDDAAFPNSWGAQVTLTLTADEKSTLTPGYSDKEPIRGATVFGSTVSQSFTAAFGGTISSQNVRYDQYDFYYNAYDLIERATNKDICHIRPDGLLGPETSSSPFVDGSKLGIAEWLPGAIAVINFERSSRAAENGEGEALGAGGKSPSDSATYDNKFLIVTSGNFSPTWNLVRIGTPSSPLLDLNRTRTNELLITIGKGKTEVVKNSKTGVVSIRNLGPTDSASTTHFAAQIGSAVAAALRN